jgi:flavin reductase (DIM6/NTAB) family NADH-FMN oxidoreductase RutF
MLTGSFTLLLFGTAAGTVTGRPASAQTTTSLMPLDTVIVGVAPMYPTKNIIENAVKSKNHTTLRSRG